MKKRLRSKEKKVLKKIRNRRINLLMKVNPKILLTHLVALFSLKEENRKAIVPLATERTRKKIKSALEIEKEREIERKKRRKTRTNPKKWKRKRAINAVRAETERKRTIDDNIWSNLTYLKEILYSCFQPFLLPILNKTYLLFIF